MLNGYQKTGMLTRRKVLGDRHVSRAQSETTTFDCVFQDLITDAAWGHVWSSPDLSHRDRSLITLALLAALGHWEEVAMHIRATRNTGASPEEVRSALMHVAIYAGVPAGNQAFRIAKDTYREMGIDFPSAQQD